MSRSRRRGGPEDAGSPAVAGADAAGSAPRGRGRPRLPAPSEPVSVRLYPEEYDRLIREAARRNQSISALVRVLLRIRLQ